MARLALRLLLVVALLLVPGRVRAGVPTATLVETVTAELRGKELHVKLRSSLREPVVAAGSAPTMPPFFAKAELEDAVVKFGPYVLSHVRLLARTTPIAGRVVSTKIAEPIEAPVHQANDLEKFHTEAELVY